MSKLQIIGAAIALCLPTSAALSTDSNQIPANLLSLVSAQDTVLAVKSAKPLGMDDEGTVVVVRHAPGDGQRRNPCELIVLKNDNGKLAVSERNDKVVECTYNEAAKNADALGLNNNLNLASDEITYFNESARGGTTYTFMWSKEKSTWHLQHVEASSVQNGDAGVVVYKSILDYPSSLPWISLTAFDPKLIRGPIAKNRKAVK